MTVSLVHPTQSRRHSNHDSSPGLGLERRRWELRGTVQGVGFRPFVHRLATDLGLHGRVRNLGGIVVIDADGPAPVLEAFETRLRIEAPPLSEITALIQLTPSADAPYAGFVIEQSAALSENGAGPAHRDVPPDAAICGACFAELFDPADRRYRYPFINCVDCGPRATIISDLPYDRSSTTMDRFPLCPQCEGEYRDPANRRFHAEPVACPVCGPQLSWRAAGDSGVRATADEALRAAAACVEDGGIIALKGLGGYQFVCDATDEDAVRRLRARKNRPTKPFAVMVEDIHTAERYARLCTAEHHLLVGAARPIVLAEPRAAHARAPIAPSVRAGSPSLGLFLPTTGLHHLLLRELNRPLVVTSGNLGGEPIIIDDLEAWERLTAVADGVCAHDRQILARYDDSVALVHGDAPSVVRRARGYSPAPLRLPIASPEPVLAAGAQLKHTFTLATGHDAVTSTHLGDLSDAATYESFLTGLDRLGRLHGIDPHCAAHDLHPGYLSTQYVQEHFPPADRIAVQHHHAHIASCAAEHGLTGDVIGVAYDGLGLGDDGTLWGGEVMVANLTGYTRLGRFARAPMPGGAAAVAHPDRMALGYLAGLESLGAAGPDPFLTHRFISRMEPAKAAALLRMISQRTASPLTSSAGRLFDAAAAILGLRGTVSFEGEAAIALEAAAGHVQAPPLPWRLARGEDGLWVYDPAPTLNALLAGSCDERQVPRLAAAFHATIAEVTLALVRHAAHTVGAKPVCLSGGVWQNRRLTEAVLDLLDAEGFDVFLNQRVPCNDGGISYGQAAVAAATLAGR
jgi:hydrogenase maturation protein HypF